MKVLKDFLRDVIKNSGFIIIFFGVEWALFVNFANDI